MMQTLWRAVQLLMHGHLVWLGHKAEAGIPGHGVALLETLRSLCCEFPARVQQGLHSAFLSAKVSLGILGCAKLYIMDPRVFALSPAPATEPPSVLKPPVDCSASCSQSPGLGLFLPQ